ADGSAEEYSGIQHEYCLALYLFYMEDLVADAVYSLVSFAKSKVDDGTMKRGRLIYPTLLEWYSHTDETDEETSVYSDFSQPRDFEQGTKVVNPSHIAPANAWERWAATLAKVPRILGSDLSMFGLRVACASLCLGIVALLQDTQEFFIRQRGVWAMIVVVIGMSPTSGQALFGFFSRLFATVAAVALSFVSWYIVVGNAAGVLVFLYLSNVLLVSNRPWQRRDKTR
ncbi:FUSC family protein, partial [Candidatus Bathyarchaeota archaeon]|nr:FUSC family protein [Candidatus Bathyarchaeota archaeon]